MGQSMSKLFRIIKSFFIQEKNEPILIKNQKSLFDDFQTLKLIGRGSQAEVYKVKQTQTGKEYAMKIIIKDKNNNNKQKLNIESELSILQQMNSQYILKLIYYLEDNEKIGFVTELMWRDLRMYLQKYVKLEEEKVIQFAAEIVLALKHLHSQQYIYKDLKPENILLDFEGHIKLADFGISRKISFEDQTFSGTKEYSAPEILMAQHLSVMVDWWSLGSIYLFRGVIIFELLTGINPFFNEKIQIYSQLYLIQDYQHKYKIIFENILNAQINFQQYNLSQNAEDLIFQLLQIDVLIFKYKPQKRLGFYNGSDDIQIHKFFQNINWTQIQNKQKNIIFTNTLSQENSPLNFIDFDSENLI